MKDHSLSVIRLDNKNPVPHQKKIFLLHVTLFYPLLFKAKKKKKDSSFMIEIWFFLCYFLHILKIYFIEV